jgi:hypothetical protein
MDGSEDRVGMKENGHEEMQVDNSFLIQVSSFHLLDSLESDKNFFPPPPLFFWRMEEEGLSLSPFSVHRLPGT